MHSHPMAGSKTIFLNRGSQDCGIIRVYIPDGFGQDITADSNLDALGQTFFYKLPLALGSFHHYFNIQLLRMISDGGQTDASLTVGKQD